MYLVHTHSNIAVEGHYIIRWKTLNYHREIHRDSLWAALADSGKEETYIRYILYIMIYQIIILKQLYFAADQTRNFSIYHQSLYTSYTIISLLFFISSVFFYYRNSHGVLLSQQRLLASYGSEKILKSCRNKRVLVTIFFVCFFLVQLPSFLCGSITLGVELYNGNDHHGGSFQCLSGLFV